MTHRAAPLISNDHYRQMIEGVEDYAILMLDPIGHILSWNKGAEKIKGYRAEEIVGSHFRKFYTEIDQSLRVPEGYLAEARELGHVQHEGWRVRKDGSLFWGHVTITALLDDNGDVNGYCKVTYDRTDILKQDEMDKRLVELEARNKEMEQFVYIASHDLTEPVNTIGSFAKLLQEEYGNVLDDMAMAYVNQMQASAQRMKDLIIALLQYARLGRDRHLVHTNTGDLVTSVLADMHQRIASTGAQVFYNDLPILYVFPVEFRLLIQNLISNGVKFTRPGVPPVIDITATQMGGMWTFCVADNGIGISKEDREKAFIIFKRLNNEDQYDGSGIGLAYCRKIVEMHNGSIWIEANIPTGCRFYFTINT